MTVSGSSSCTHSSLWNRSCQQPAMNAWVVLLIIRLSISSLSGQRGPEELLFQLDVRLLDELGISHQVSLDQRRKLLRATGKRIGAHCQQLLGRFRRVQYPG